MEICLGQEAIIDKGDDMECEVRWMQSQTLSKAQVYALHPSRLPPGYTNWDAEDCDVFWRAAEEEKEELVAELPGIVSKLFLCQMVHLRDFVVFLSGVIYIPGGQLIELEGRRGVVVSLDDGHATVLVDEQEQVSLSHGRPMDVPI